ncbi:MAG: conjugal transfer protein TraD [Cyanobacteria bacterium P01_F01_bin.86]
MTVQKDKLRAQIEKLETQIRKHQARVHELRHKERKHDQKLRRQQLTQFGELGELADLLTADRGAVLGFLLEFQNLLFDDTIFQELKEAGDQRLHQRG